MVKAITMRGVMEGTNLGTKPAEMHHQHVILSPSQALVSYQMGIKLDTTKAQLSQA